MSILDVTRGHILAEIEGRQVTVEGELLTPDEEGLPDYVVYKASIQRWNPPHDTDVIDEATREKIIEILRMEMRKRDMVIDIE
jgi:hypothetical protein